MKKNDRVINNRSNTTAQVVKVYKKYVTVSYSSYGRTRKTNWLRKNTLTYLEKQSY